MQTRIARKFNMQVKHFEALAEASASLNLSKSELVNRALRTATEDFPALVSYLISYNVPAPTEHKTTTVMIDPSITEEASQLAAKLHLSNDHLLRLALDYYPGLRHGL